MRGMRIPTLVLLAVLTAGITLAQQTPRSMVATYDALADAILALKQAEVDFAGAILQVHFAEATVAYEAGDYALAAAEMTLFGNEGDNAIEGVRKRLVDGGHHHHAADEAELYDPGYVIVTRAAKREIVQAAAAMRDAGDAAAARQAWQSFERVAGPLIPGA